MSILRATCLALAIVTPARAATVTAVFDGRIPCVAADGVQSCIGDLTSRVETFDGVPLDVNVILPPASMEGPFPLVVDLHGWSLGKSTSPQYTAWAKAGWVVLSYTARGFHYSCGNEDARVPDASLSNPTVCGERGWIRLSDARYEAHDTQHLAGLLADEGLVIPTKVAVTGASYGGGQSMILAALKNRVMQPDGTLVPWKSPNGLDMTIAAAAPLIPWSDLAYSLTPNGRTLDWHTDNPYGLRGGVQKKSWNAALYSVGFSTGFYSTPGTDFASDIQSWNARIDAGEPYDGDPTLQAILTEITSHHSAYYVDDSVPPAPLFIYNAWTDDLFPVDEALRFQRKTVAKYPSAEIAVRFADDFGHSRAALGFTGTAVLDRVTAFLARHLNGTGDAFPPFETYTQACNGATVEGPFTAADWASLHPGEVRFKSKRTQRFTEAAGSAANAHATDPLNTIGPCRTVPADDDPVAATYRLPAATGDGYTLLGSPTIVADLAVTGSNAQIVARLWDVASDGMQTLVAHTVYRPRTDNRGPQVFQLHPNAWRFAAGHVPKLELLGQSDGYVRPSNGVFAVTVSTLELRLPVHEPPGGKTIVAPAAAVEPPAQAEPLGCDATPGTCVAPETSAGLALVRGVRGALDRIDWRWKNDAPAEFDDPTDSASYAFCIYQDDTLVGSALAPGGGTCGKGPCWKAAAGGFRYADPKRASTGVRSVSLVNRHGASVAFVAGGVHTGLPALPLGSGAVTAQLWSSDGRCWGQTFPAAKKSSVRVWKGVTH
jgi:predicted acyl esterase